MRVRYFLATHFSQLVVLIFQFFELCLKISDYLFQFTIILCILWAILRILLQLVLKLGYLGQIYFLLFSEFFYFLCEFFAYFIILSKILLQFIGHFIQRSVLLPQFLKLNINNFFLIGHFDKLLLILDNPHGSFSKVSHKCCEILSICCPMGYIVQIRDNLSENLVAFLCV